MGRVITFSLPLICLLFLSFLHLRAQTNPTIDSVRSAQNLRQEDWKPLFDGKTLEGWVVEGPKEFLPAPGQKPQPIWVAHEGMICCQVNKSSFGFLRYKQTFGDFHLQLEYRFAPPEKTPVDAKTGKPRMGNSGIGIRTCAFDPKDSKGTRPSFAAYEIQLLDDAGKPANKHSTGSLYRYVAPKANPVKSAPAWNQMEVICRGPRIRILLNGQEIVDVDQSTIPELRNKPLRGSICLQNHGSAIDFRNLRVRELASKK